MLQEYVGSKIILAMPMTRNLFIEQKGKGEKVKPDEHGYKVVYPDGYESWSPKYAFENAYRPVSGGEKELRTSITATE